MALIAGAAATGAARASEPGDRFATRIEPILAQYCYGCHGGGASEGGMELEGLASIEPLATREKWYRVLRQLRAGLMPPKTEVRPDDAELAELEQWILREGLGLDPDHPDPGHTTVRRLNREEYRNTIRDLLGVEFDTTAAFPADDTGHGFDNIADVLSISPLLLEKYVDAASSIIASTVPTRSGTLRTLAVPGADFKVTLLNPPAEPEEDEEDAESEEGGAVAAAAGPPGAGRGQRGRFGAGRGAGRGFGRGQAAERQRGPIVQGTTVELSYYDAAEAVATVQLEYAGAYQIRLDMAAAETYVDNVFDSNKCEFTFSLDGEELLRREFVRQGGKTFEFEYRRELQPGDHELKITITPTSSADQVRNLRLRIKSVAFVGPDDPQYFVKPPGYDRFFPRDVPSSREERREYARELLTDFATRAYRRPVDEATVERLVALAEFVYAGGDQTFEQGIAKAMTAVLASPRFLFREEQIEESEESGDSRYPLIDQYSLASRLSYFLWSSMPDEELMRLAGEGRLRDELDAQVARMLADERSSALARNFAGQWLQARSIDSIQINSFAVMRRETAPNPEADAQRRRFFELVRKEERTEEEEKEFAELGRVFAQRQGFGRRNRVELNGEIRRAMRRETEMLFEYIFSDDRSVLEFIDSNYTFLNEALATFYQLEGIEGLDGSEMRRVELPADSVRGGVLTQGTVLVVTSNPDRTSPVKRGLFVLENLLGIPTPAPPPDIPPLEDSARSGDADERLSLRETLAIHRESAVCSSCHNRMDPLGLALENFNALGRYRDKELGQDIDAAGELITGESFTSVRELKRILVERHRDEFYRCLTEKLMMYALGREVGYHDTTTVDSIVASLRSSDGRASSLINGIVHSDTFQRTRRERRTEP